MTGYSIIGLALFVFVQARNVYPQLLLARLLFSIGGSAASTMVTAVLPTMSFVDMNDPDPRPDTSPRGITRHMQTSSLASELTITPARFQARTIGDTSSHASMIDAQRGNTSKIAGFVGMATGCGALVALSIFLPLPARFQKAGVNPGPAVQYSYYVVGTIALATASVCTIGLRNLKSERHKGFGYLASGTTEAHRTSMFEKVTTSAGLLYRAFIEGFRRREILIGYIGGFVARASSVGISLFIPLLVNAAFLSSGLCGSASALDNPVGLPDIKRRCPRAYVVAAELTGVSQFVALICAPLFGYWSSRVHRKTLPLLFSAVTGIIGYPLLAMKFDPHDDNKTARGWAFLAVCLIGISQIGAIVCSLGILSSGILQQSDRHTVAAFNGADRSESRDEDAPLLEQNTDSRNTKNTSLAELKGSVAGVYSFYGGAAILILTKAGGALFDSTSKAAPFYLMASFNVVLLATCLVVGVAMRPS